MKDPEQFYLILTHTDIIDPSYEFGGVCDDGFTDTSARNLCRSKGWANGRKGPSQILDEELEFKSTLLQCSDEGCSDMSYELADPSSPIVLPCARNELASVYCFNSEYITRLFIYTT